MNSSGHFGFFSLYNWWVDSFTNEEKNRFKELYKPLGGSYEDLFTGPGGFSNSKVWFLTMLAGFARGKADKDIALKFLQKAEEESDNCSNMDKHFLFHELIESHYKLREVTSHYDLAKYYCKRQISISFEARQCFVKEFGDILPGHLGYHQLAIILEKENKLEEAIKICKRALVERWKGDWVKRIEKLQRKSQSI